jgi:hypothetical protein
MNNFYKKYSLKINKKEIINYSDFDKLDEN